MFVKLGEAEPLVEQVYRSFRRVILTGELPPRARLPSTRALARELGVSRNTALHAYDQLLAEGYAEARAGSGTYVAAALPDAALSVGARRSVSITAPAVPRLSAYGRHLAGVSWIPAAASNEGRLPYDFRYGLPAVADFPHAVWRRVVARRARSASLGSMTYGPPEGHAPLREALASYLGRSRGVTCDPLQIVIVNGSQQALDLVSRVLLDPGDGVIIEEPQYAGARRVFLAAGATLLPVAVDGEGLDVHALERTRRTARLAYVTPSHQFPTGVVMSLGRRLALLEWAKRADAHVVEDDYDSEYRYEGRPIEAVQGLDHSGRAIYVGTLSKVLFPALRVGYLVLPPALVETVKAAKWVTDRHTPTLEQEVLTDFIGEGHFERHVRRARTRNAGRRAALLDALSNHLGDRVEIVGANAGVHLLVWLRDVPPASLNALIARAARAGVGVYPIAPYYLKPPPRAGLLLGYAALNERQIRTGIRRFAEVLEAGGHRLVEEPKPSPYARVAASPTAEYDTRRER